MSVRLSYAFEKGTSVTYTYDAGGSRASKTVNGTKSEFVYLDGKLVYEKRGGDDIFYLYDSYGSLSNIRWYKNGASLHTNAYYRYINDRLRPVAGDRVAVEMTLDSLRNEILERSLLGIRWD